MPSKYPARGRGSRAKVCRQCGRGDREAGRMSARGLCHDCAAQNVNEAIDAMTAAQGPIYELWQTEWERGMRSFVETL